MTGIDEFLTEIAEIYDDDMLYPTDLKEAIIGTIELFDSTKGIITRLVLDKNKCLSILMENFKDDGCSEEEAYTLAIEHFDFNVIGSYVDGVPAYITFIGE